MSQFTEEQIENAKELRAMRLIIQSQQEQLVKAEERYNSLVKAIKFIVVAFLIAFVMREAIMYFSDYSNSTVTQEQASDTQHSKLKIESK